MRVADAIAPASQARYNISRHSALAMDAPEGTPEKNARKEMTIPMPTAKVYTEMEAKL